MKGQFLSLLQNQSQLWRIAFFNHHSWPMLATESKTTFQDLLDFNFGFPQGITYFTQLRELADFVLRCASDKTKNVQPAKLTQDLVLHQEVRYIPVWEMDDDSAPFLTYRGFIFEYENEWDSSRSHEPGDYSKYIFSKDWSVVVYPVQYSDSIENFWIKNVDPVAQYDVELFPVGSGDNPIFTRRR